MLLFFSCSNWYLSRCPIPRFIFIFFSVFLLFVSPWREKGGRRGTQTQFEHRHSVYIYQNFFALDRAIAIKMCSCNDPCLCIFKEYVFPPNLGKVCLEDKNWKLPRRYVEEFSILSKIRRFLGLTPKLNQKTHKRNQLPVSFIENHPVVDILLTDEVDHVIITVKVYVGYYSKLISFNSLSVNYADLQQFFVFSSSGSHLELVWLKIISCGCPINNPLLQVSLKSISDSLRYFANKQQLKPPCHFAFCFRLISNQKQLDLWPIKVSATCWRSLQHNEKSYWHWWKGNVRKRKLLCCTHAGFMNY